MMSDSPARSDTSPRVFSESAHAILENCAFALIGIASVVLLAGCPQKPAAVSRSGSSAPTQSDIDEQCELIIGTVHDTFHLDRLEMTTTLADGVARLNDWGRACGPESPAPGELPAEIAGLLGKEQLEYLQNPLFTLRDGAHLQDGVMLRAISRALAASQPAGGAEVDRVVRAFQYVIRSIELVPGIPTELALTAYEICELGKGTAADRAWIFASLLKQERIDAVLISPAREPAKESEMAPFLVGVLIENQVYLFDPTLGVPIPAIPGNKGPAVATLEQAATDPEVLRQLDAGAELPYPIKAADLERPAVSIISESGYWPERMRSLQEQFSGDQAMVISDSLQDIDGVPGVISRIASAGQNSWSRDALKMWDYPEQQLSRRMKLSEQIQDERAKLFTPFYAYVTIVPDPKTGKLMIAEQEELADPAAGKFDPGVVMRKRTTVRAQLRARLKHLAGDASQAVMDYHDVWQHSKRVLEFGPPAALRIMHARAMDDSTYWTALCKFEQGEYQVAIDTCLNYRRKYALGSWRRQVRYLLALSYLAAGDRAAAIKELEEVDSKDPEYAGYQLLIRQWKTAEAPTSNGQ